MRKLTIKLPLSTNPELISCESIDELFEKYKNMYKHTPHLQSPGPAHFNTHPYLATHTHTQVFASCKKNKRWKGAEKKPGQEVTGNKEAVGKYREKEEQHAALLRGRSEENLRL
ncbi:hypothetical protein MA16_Dca022845 [Dendrobium catenatum]|uniref:Uncharacterized protein n=1 Tax=Dendrobium catenatum TaxID=906689 RepID=A0A2I0X0A7_9ASPA|nr:hypothetical protein MA16_Dca022845 [Dendrobium catenatum]